MCAPASSGRRGWGTVDAECALRAAPRTGPHEGAERESPSNIRLPLVGRVIGDTGEQAHLPAQQPPPGEDPRVPAADAHAGGPRHPGRPASQGPRQPVRLSCVLPAVARLRRREDFTLVVRRGQRAGRGTLVVHRLIAGGGAPSCPSCPPRVGFIVGRGVGNAVRRHEVSRRLRHLMRERLDRLVRGDRLVIRANPASAGRTSAELAADLDRALSRLGVVEEAVAQ